MDYEDCPRRNSQDVARPVEFSTEYKREAMRLKGKRRTRIHGAKIKCDKIPVRTSKTSLLKGHSKILLSKSLNQGSMHRGWRSGLGQRLFTDGSTRSVEKQSIKKDEDKEEENKALSSISQ